jgi:glucosyl-3-phosphoglycerate synthase
MAFEIKKLAKKLNIKNLFRKSKPKLAQYKSKDFTNQLFLSHNRPTISVCVLTKDCASTIDNTLSVLDDCLANGYIDQVVVVDADSPDGTAEIAKKHEALVVQQDELLPQFGPALGKGDAMWRAQSVMTGEIIVYQDGDLFDYAMRHVLGVAGPLLKNPNLSFVKGTYRRHLRSKGTVVKDGGGRVSTLTARPLLKAFYPQLHDFRQPLSGEAAIRKSLLEKLPIVTGYGIEIAMMIDVYRECGIEAMAEVDLQERHNNHQSLQELAAMAETVTQTILSRVYKEGRYDAPVESPVERPAFNSLQNSAH